MILGFDFSHYQKGTLDFAKAKAAGYVFAFGKVSDGLDPDPTWDERAKAVLDAGLILGGYHFGRPMVKPEDQADFFLGRLPRGVPILAAGDWEDSHVQENGKQDWDMLDAEMRGTIVQDFQDPLGVAMKAVPFLYTYSAFSDKYLTAVPLGTYRLWLSKIGVSIPLGWQFRTLWQYSYDGQVPGIGQVDLDRFEGTADELAAMCGRL